MKLICILLFASACFAQAPPDAPQPHTCGGKPCDGWMYRIAGDRHIEMLPARIKPDSFFTFNDGYHVLHPNKKCWAFWLVSEGAAWGALAAANHQKEPWHSEAPARAAVMGLDFLALKGLSPSLSVEGGVYGFIHYVRAR